MIEFNGELTGDCKKFLLNKQKKSQLIVSVIVLMIFSPPIVLVAIHWKIDALLFMIPLSLFLVGSVIPISKNAQKIFMPKKVFLDLEENTIVHQCEKMERFHMIDSVKSVIDYGDWYHLIFYYSDRDMYFVCQKSLLTKGTLEEFEALFEGKIERRIPKNK